MNSEQQASKVLQFPDGFFWGTSTAAAQIETATAHNWRGVESKDGYTFHRTTDHELRRDEDAELISQLGSVYRCGVDWARLQSAPMAKFDPIVVSEYLAFFEKLHTSGTKIMFVLHHFTNPLWFEGKEAWINENNLPAFINYAEQCIESFGAYASFWNTFNEPNVYALNGYLTAHFPPFKKNKYSEANAVLANMGKAHNIIYGKIKTAFPDAPIGISFNTAHFEGKNILGKIPAKLIDWWFMDKAASYFEQVDFWGLSYYAYILFDPTPITEIDRPGELARSGIPHDRMWGYRPSSIGEIVRRFYKKYQKPIIITENGICSDDPQRRIQCLKDYLTVLHGCIEDGIPIHGYIHWSTFDNFEWSLGPTYRFGLIAVDMETKDRTMTEAGVYFNKICKTNSVPL